MTKRNKKSNNPLWIPVLGMSALGILTLVLGWMVRGKDIALLNPKGVVADEQFKLLILTTSIMLAFAAIVLFFIYFFAWRFREKGQGDTPDPNSGRNKKLMFIAWASPIAVFIILASIMLPATQKLEPQKSIESENEELTIRVVAMRWKWVFMYPEQGIATVNFVQIPVDTPVRFELTADEAPMQSFWIPHLGGMLYSMTEHVNPLNLMGHTIGDYDGGAAEINGHGFAGMRFIARVSARGDFDQWVYETSTRQLELDAEEYQRLLEPSEYVEPMAYTSPDNEKIFDNLLKKYAGSHSHYQVSEDSEHGGER